jgi:hypothetical protein
VNPTAVGDLALILLVAIGGKFGGAFLAARMCRIAPRESAALAALMNTRGLTELVILSVGLQLGVLDTTLYSLMVLMAVVTTAMTSPLLMAFYPQAADRPGSCRGTAARGTGASPGVTPQGARPCPLCKENSQRELNPLGHTEGRNST